MSISEKTLELNICSQIYHNLQACDFNVVWRGLTQQQEAEEGFDAATKLSGGCFLAFQFKKPEYKVRRKLWMFETPCHQLDALTTLSKKETQLNPRSKVFYAFNIDYCSPNIDSCFFDECCIEKMRTAGPNYDFLFRTWLIDVAQLQGQQLPPVVPRKKPLHRIFADCTGAKMEGACNQLTVCNLYCYLRTLCKEKKDKRGVVEPSDNLSKILRENEEISRDSDRRESEGDTTKRSPYSYFTGRSFGALITPKGT